MAKTNRFILDIGTTAFILGLVLVVFMGLGLAGNYKEVLIGVIFVIGLIVGMMDITAEEMTSYMYACTILVVVSYMGLLIIKGGVTSEEMPVWIRLITGILEGMLILFVPSTIVVATKSVFSMAKNR